MIMQYIYAIRNIINTMIYVGKTSNACKRKADHWYCARKGDTRPLYEAMRQLGVENFSFEIVEECLSEDIAVKREEYWISHFDSFNNGYNLTPNGGFHVGNRGRRFSEEHKRKLSEAHKGKVLSTKTRKKIGDARRGQKRGPRSLITKEKISAGNRGKILSAETRRKISESLKGSTLSDETKQRISTAGKGRKHTPEAIEKMRIAAKRREERKRLEREGNA